MKNHTSRPGFLAVAVMTASVAAFATRADEAATEFMKDKVQCLSSSRLSIAYQAAMDGGRATQVDGYVTDDQGRTWRQFSSQRPSAGLNTGTQPKSGSMGFEAESDGLFGFFVVLHNAAGASSPPPESGTAPQQWIRVDREAPLVQILEVRPDERFDLNRDLMIRWTVEDVDLPDRPVSLHYRSEETKSYRLIAESLGATSAYRWTIPEDLRAPIEIKVTAVDRAGNVGRSILSDVAFEATAHPPAVSAQNAPKPLPSAFQGLRPKASSPRREMAQETAKPIPDFSKAMAHGDPDAGSQPADPRVNEDARRKYDAGTWHRLRGEMDLALARYQEALEIDPQYLAARHDMAGLLLLMGRPEEAEKELLRVLSTEPAHRGALKTLALVQTRLQNYRSAGETLQRLLLLEPKDAEAWLYFGDVTMFMGDRAGAREAWAKVGGLEGVSEEVRRRANERMKLYPGRVNTLELASGEPEP